MLTSAIKDPDVRAKLVDQGLDVVGSCGDAFRTHIKRQREEYARIIKDAGIKIG